MFCFVTSLLFFLGVGRYYRLLLDWWLFLFLLLIIVVVAVVLVLGGSCLVCLLFLLCFFCIVSSALLCCSFCLRAFNSFLVFVRVCDSLVYVFDVQTGNCVCCSL